MKSKKGQEEIVGFVLIMVIVSIVFLVFLGIVIRKGPSDARESADVFHFLESGMEYTTDCATRFAPDYSSLGELFRECYEGNACLNGKTACGTLEETLNGLIEESWQFGEDRPVKGYKFESYYLQAGSQNKEEVVSISNGICEGRIIGNSYLVPAFPGRIVNEFEVCY